MVDSKGRTSLVQKRTLGEELERDFQVRGATVTWLFRD